MKILVKLGPKATIFAKNDVVVLVGQIVEVEQDATISHAIAMGHLIVVSPEELNQSQGESEALPEGKPKKVSKIALDK